MNSLSHLLQVRDLKTYFYAFEGVAKAVDDVSFDLDKRDTLGLVGESGWGKGVTGLSIVRLIPEPPGRIQHGRIRFDGIDLLHLSMSQTRTIQSNRISMIFQEPVTSLNVAVEPLLEVEDLKVHLPIKKGVFSGTVGYVYAVDGISFTLSEDETIGLVGESEGGKTTTGLAILRLIEPVSALDVSIQAQTINLFIDLQEEIQLSYVIISHDLAVVAYSCDPIAVMYLRKIVEMATHRDLYADPKHPYTQALCRLSLSRTRRRPKRELFSRVMSRAPSTHRLDAAFIPDVPTEWRTVTEENPR